MTFWWIEGNPLISYSVYHFQRLSSHPTGKRQSCFCSSLCLDNPPLHHEPEILASETVHIPYLCWTAMGTVPWAAYCFWGRKHSSGACPILNLSLTPPARCDYDWFAPPRSHLEHWVAFLRNDQGSQYLSVAEFAYSLSVAGRYSSPSCYPSTCGLTHPF